MKNFFKPEDFKNLPEYAEHLANTANQKLNALIESWPVVYGSEQMCVSNEITPIKEKQWRLNQCVTGFVPENTHKARLAFIEEIVKEPCKHEPKQVIGTENAMWAECAKCGVELVPTWSAKK